MISSGLLSITFRKLTAEDIVELVVQAGLQAIEWGGDKHVPHGDRNIAINVGVLTRNRGLEVASYGSYYYVGGRKPGNPSFDDVLESAIHLQAPAIRVWAGHLGTDDPGANEAWWTEVVADAQRIGDLAMREGITVDFEYHGGTLTDHGAAAVRLMEAVDRPNVRCNWQPAVDISVDERLASLEAISPWLANAHVFQWQSRNRLALAEGKADWKQYISVMRQTGEHHYAMLEFVKDDSPEQFLQDAKVLLNITQSPLT